MDSREVLQAIRSRGADLSRRREVVAYFYGPPPRLVDLQRGLERLGFAVRPTRTEPGLIATMDAVADEAWARDMTPKLCRLAAQHGVEYDGWEAAIPEAKPGAGR